MNLVTWYRTCGACPEQWEGTTDAGQHVYLRHRHGFGYVGIGPTPDEAVIGKRILLAWVDDEQSGCLPDRDALDAILYLAGLSRRELDAKENP